MRRLVPLLSVVLALAACSTAVPRLRVDTASVSRREGPVSVGVDLLLDPAIQERWFGHRVDDALIARLLPIGVVVENTGARPVALRESGALLELRTRGEHAPLDPRAAVAALQESYDAIVAAGPPGTAYPTAEDLLIRTRALCMTTGGLGCLLIPPAAIYGGFVDLGHLFTERMHHPSRLRALKVAYQDLRAREEAHATEGDAWIGQGQTGHRVFYFPIESRNAEALSRATVTVRLAVPTGSEIVVPIELGAL